MFVKPPVASFDVTVGDGWSYTLPEAVDPEGTGVAVTVGMGTASIFTKFADNTFTIDAG
jgi:hypothetical protein